MAQIITKKKEVEYRVAVAYDGTTFSEEKFGSIDAAKAEAEKYDSSAEGIVTNRAMKVLKKYRLPDNVPTLEEQSKEIQENASQRGWIKRLYTNPDELVVNCIASGLYTDHWSCLSDTAAEVYIFKPKTQEDIDIVTQYTNLKNVPLNLHRYNESDYGTIAELLNKYRLGNEQPVPGKTYMLITVPDNECTIVVDVHEWLSKVSAFVDDVDAKY